jgi:(2Fe-2S) ferredoxin
MLENNLKFDKHIFICTNQRPAGTRISCGEEHGLKLVADFKKKLNDRKLTLPVRAQKAGCFDICEEGPNVVIYPEGVFYGKVKSEDIDEIIEEHIIKGKIVERLKLSFKR